MIFSSYKFIFVFLPAFFFVYFLSLKYAKHLRLYVILLFSLIFYSVYDVSYLVLLLFSIGVNYYIAELLIKREVARERNIILFLGVSFNLSLIIYYKYINFIIENVMWLSNSNIAYMDILLPLGISFFTFQQIAYLVDVHKDKLYKYGLLEYAVFVSYFPQLIAGPIVHHKKFISQLTGKAFGKFDVNNVIIGLSVFAIGLFKKVVIADSLAHLTDRIFNIADQGVVVPFLNAWMGALSYAFQIYFDFSGYADMALGLAIVIGIYLPINFNSPYKSRSIIEFWQKWHITLSAFLKNYLYIPLGGNRYGSFNKFRNLAIVMLLGGLWHGASWNFVIWGGLHGCFLIVNHAWRHYRKDKQKSRSIRQARVATILSWLLTMIVVVFAWVFFRAETLDGAIAMSKSMLALSPDFKLIVPYSFELFLANYGFELNEDIFVAGVLLSNVHILSDAFIPSIVGLLICVILVTAFPNTIQLFSQSSQLIAIKSDSPFFLSRQTLFWRPTFFWGVAIGILFIMSILMLSEATEFIYFEF